jgi:predicted phage terminase large subunit-like protein
MSLIEDPNVEWIESDVVITTGSTFDNADNLPKALLQQLKRQYAGTSIGEQELYGKVLDDIAGALWQRKVLDEFRIRAPFKPPPLKRVVVGVDPMVMDIALRSADMVAAGKRRPGGSETGIVCAGLGIDDHCYILDDQSLMASPLTWANRAVATLAKWKGDRIIAEQNNGGALVETTLRSVNENIPYRAVTASRGKITRAEPVAALYEQGRVHHVGVFTELEDQLVTYTGDPNERSPDRLDALVWAVTELMLANSAILLVGAGGPEGENPWSMPTNAG